MGWGGFLRRHARVSPWRLSGWASVTGASRRAGDPRGCRHWPRRHGLALLMSAQRKDKIKERVWRKDPGDGLSKSDCVQTGQLSPLKLPAAGGATRKALVCSSEDPCLYRASMFHGWILSGSWLST